MSDEEQVLLNALVSAAEQARAKALVDAAKAVCWRCSQPQGHALTKRGPEDFRHADDEREWPTRFVCHASPVWALIERESGLEAVKRHSPRGWVDA